MAVNIPETLDRLCFRYPSLLVDAIREHQPGQRLVAIKNVTVNEEFLQGTFGHNVDAAVLMIESFVQVATILILEQPGMPPRTRAYLRGVNERSSAARWCPASDCASRCRWAAARALGVAQATAYIDDQVVAECQLLLGLAPALTHIRPHGRRWTLQRKSAKARASALTRSSARTSDCGRLHGRGLGRGSRAGTDIGEGTEIFPFA